MKLLVNLFPDRNREGSAVIIDPPSIPGLAFSSLTFRCLARSDSSAAISHQNPNRDPMKPFGDLPLGTYSAVDIGRASPITEVSKWSYGLGARYLLTPIGGETLKIKGVRSGLLIHGGPIGTPMPPNRLRPTHGCLRVEDSSIALLESTGLKSFDVEVLQLPS